MSEHTQGIVTVLSLVNPLICAAMFGGIAAGRTSAEKFAAASKAALSIALILCLAALGGAQVLRIFGISLPAFQLAGGIILSWMGLKMLHGNASPTSASNQDSQPKSLVPLILFAASPGTITGVITLAVSQSQGGIPTAALVSVVVAIGVTWVVMLLAPGGSAGGQPSLVHDVSSRFMGLIVMAMGVQFALSAIGQFFATNGAA